MDFNSTFGAEFREVQDGTRDGKPVRTVIATRTYTTDRADLWNAMTDAERIPRWFSPVSGDLKLGGRFQIEGNAAGTILTCDAPETLEITWEFGGKTSWVQVSLAQEGDGTRMKLQHFTPMDEAADEHWKQYGPGAVGVGWDLTLVGLALHVDSGQAIDQKESFAWMASDKGKVFIRDSAKSWGEAHVKGGEERGVAEAMAERTAAFYTGG